MPSVRVAASLERERLRTPTLAEDGIATAPRWRDATTAHYREIVCASSSAPGRCSVAACGLREVGRGLARDEIDHVAEREIGVERVQSPVGREYAG